MPNLSDHDKSIIQECLEKNKPLDNKFRFLLFNDEQEVELLWNGKTESLVGPNLPFQHIEQVDEVREGKSLQGSLDMLDQRGRQDKGWVNKLIWGDNKLILSSFEKTDQ